MRVNLCYFIYLDIIENCYIKFNNILTKFLINMGENMLKINF